MVEEDCKNLNVEGALSSCTSCGARLCLRKQVINLSLGHVENMFCLNCLGKDSERPPQEVLGGVKGYILTRQCFKKEWVRYVDDSYCPDREHCFPSICFGDGEDDSED